MSRKQTAESFWARVKKSSECWNWQGSCNSTGYGTVGWDGQNYTAHRIAAWLSNLVDSPSAPKSSAEKAHVLHRCDNRKCCNPAHLFIGSYSDNQYDAYAKKRRVQPNGESHANAKLTWKQASEIRGRYAAGELQVPLAKEFKVSQVAISLIIRNKTYTCPK